MENDENTSEKKDLKEKKDTQSDQSDKPIYYCKLSKKPLYVAHERRCKLSCLYLSEYRDLPFEDAIKKCECATPDHQKWHEEVYTPIYEAMKREENALLEDAHIKEREQLIKEILEKEPIYVPRQEHTVADESAKNTHVYMPDAPKDAVSDLNLDESRYVEGEFGVKILVSENKLIYKADLDGFIRYFQTKNGVGYLQTDFNDDGTEFILKFTKDSKYQSKTYKILSRKENDVILEEMVEQPTPVDEHLYDKGEEDKGYTYEH